MKNEKGFSLVEMMITLAISAIIIGAAFGSYTIISRNFEWQKDMKYISQSARNVIEMIQKDIRNAGFRFEANAAITDPVKIYDAGDCCDRIEIIYDETVNKRVKIEYRLQQYSSNNSRFRLYKKKTNMTSDVVEYDSPIADYVEVLQFTGSRAGETALSGAEVWGQGNLREIKPSSVVAACEHPLPNPGLLSASGSASFAIDGDVSTVYSCNQQSPVCHNQIGYSGSNFGCVGLLKFTFPKKMRITHAEVFFAANIDGGSYGSNPPITTCSYTTCPLPEATNFNNTIPIWSSPYAENRTFFQSLLFTAKSEGCVFNPNVHPTCYITPAHSLYRKFYDGRTTSNSHKVDFITGQDHKIDYQVFNQLDVAVSQLAVTCNYDNNDPRKCQDVIVSEYYELADIKFFGEVYGEPTTPHEVEISLLLISPNEHGNVNREFIDTIGNYSISKNDKYLRDNYGTSATMRNVFYQYQ